MQIIRQDRIDEFCRKVPRATTSLRRWQAIVEGSHWANFLGVRKTFSSADYVSGKIVFNIGGNNYRLIAVIDYNQQRVIVMQVLTHSEYDQGRWKK